MEKASSSSDSISGPAKEDNRAICVWKPIPNLTHEDENTLDGYLELACSPAILHAGRNKEFAMHLLYQVGGSVKVRLELKQLDLFYFLWLLLFVNIIMLRSKASFIMMM